MKNLLLPFFACLLIFTSCQNGSRSESATATDAATTDAAPAPATEKEQTSESITEEKETNQSVRKTPGQITAGEWNDLAHWDFWNSLMKEDIYGNMPGIWSFNLGGRIQVKATDNRGGIAADVPVRLLSGDHHILWESRTDNKGEVNLFPLMNEQQTRKDDLKIQAGDDQPKKISLQQQVNRLTIPGYNRPEAVLDAAFVVDATGSMSDEMDYLKAELTDVIGKVADHNSGLTIHTAAVFYRDEDDAYLTRKSDFTNDISETVQFIRKQDADGGGDFPEAVHTALDVALNELEWSSVARARILFLVLDAPPHQNQDVITKVNKLVALASRKGVRIVPVVSSGIDKETEFLMRYMAIATGGTYVFLTDDSGIGNSHLQPTVGRYDVEYLNDLMVRLIDSYVAVNGRQQASLQ